jgi:hypothetical protein
MAHLGLRLPAVEGLHELGEGDPLLQPPRDIVERRVEPGRRVVAVEPQRNLALLVEKHQRRRELHAQAGRELLLGRRAAVGPHHFAVAPDVERQRDEMPAHALHRLGLAEVHFEQPLAIRAAVLAEVEHHALLLLRRVGHVLRQVKQRLGEPGRHFLCSRRDAHEREREE